VSPVGRDPCGWVHREVVGSRAAPAGLEGELVVLALRRACEATEVEKIKSIGDAYMAVGGLPGTRADHIGAIAELAIGMVSSVRDVEPADGRPWRTGSGSTPDPQ
jgi:class 3 adenylate cyclase